MGYAEEWLYSKAHVVGAGVADALWRLLHGV